jgi:EmrB/QacA subfamily drug resistance transporter
MADDTELVRWSTPRGRWVLAATVGGSSVASLDLTVVALALPALGRDLHADFADLQWVVTGYTLTLAALILLVGAASDRYGRKRVFQFGLVWFGVSSLACAVSPTANVLIGARVVQGIGGALITPGSLAIISSTFHPDDRGAAIGAWSGLGGVATAIGPFVGGWLVDASWRLIFLLNLPLIAAVLVITAHCVPESRDPDAPERLDVPGAVLAVAGLAAMTYGLIQRSLPPGLAGGVLLVAFVVLERRRREPMLPVDVFANRAFDVINVMTFVIYGAFGMVLFLLGLVLQIAMGYSPLEAGAAEVPVTLLMLALSSRSGALADRIGPRFQLALGPILVGAGLALMAAWVEPGAGYVTGVLPPVLLFGAGLTVTVAPLTTAVLAAAEDRHAGIASGINNAVARTGSLLAIAAIPVLAGFEARADVSPRTLVDGFQVVAIVGGALCAASGVGGWVGLVGRGPVSADAAAAT